MGIPSEINGESRPQGAGKEGGMQEGSAFPLSLAFAAPLPPTLLFIWGWGRPVERKPGAARLHSWPGRSAPASASTCWSAGWRPPRASAAAARPPSPPRPRQPLRPRPPPPDSRRPGEGGEGEGTRRRLGPPGLLSAAGAETPRGAPRRGGRARGATGAPWGPRAADRPWASRSGGRTQTRWTSVAETSGQVPGASAGGAPGRGAGARARAASAAAPDQPRPRGPGDPARRPRPASPLPLLGGGGVGWERGRRESRIYWQLCYWSETAGRQLGFELAPRDPGGFSSVLSPKLTGALSNSLVTPRGSLVSPRPHPPFSSLAFTPTPTTSAQLRICLNLGKLVQVQVLLWSFSKTGDTEEGSRKKFWMGLCGNYPAILCCQSRLGASTPVQPSPGGGERDSGVVASKVPAVSEFSPQSAKCSSSGFSCWHLPWAARDTGLRLSPTWVVNSSSPATRNRTVSLSPRLPFLFLAVRVTLALCTGVGCTPACEGYNRLSIHANARCVRGHGLLEVTCSLQLRELPQSSTRATWVALQPQLGRGHYGSDRERQFQFTVQDLSLPEL